MTRRLYRPRPVSVLSDSDGTPAVVGRSEIEAVREHWLVEDRWWTARPLRRRYFELMTKDGADRIVFLDLDSGRWFSQKGA
jgi:hypothetical protein